MPAKRRATEEADEQGDTASEARLASYKSPFPAVSEHSLIIISMNSCESCKSRKLKCDRAQPSCNRCQRSSTECVYNERKRPGFQAGFRQSMEERIGLLEQEVQLLKTQRSTPSVTTLERGNTVNTTSSGTSQSLPSRVENAQAFDSIPWTRTRDVIERCPPPDLVYSLISLYFRHIHPWFPVLCPQRVFGSFANPESVEEPSLLQYAIFGITLVFSNDPRLDMAATDSYWKYCKRKIMLAMLEDPSYEALEALVILTLDLSGMTNGPQVWGVQAVIVNLSVQLGLADENSSAIMNVVNGVSPPADENLRRRLFWGIYMIDRYISMTTPHPCRLDEKIVHRWLPGQKPPNAPPTSNSSSQQITSTFGDNIDQFDQRLRLMDLTSKIHNVNLQFTNLAANDSPAMWVAEAHKQNEALSQWFNYLPQRFCLRQDSPTEWNSAPWDPGFMMLHAGYHSLIVYLNAPLAYPFHQTHVTSSSEPAIYRALNSTQMLGRILTTAQEKGFMNMLGWPFAWTLWNACRFLLIHEYRSKILFSPLFRQLHTGLQDLARFWQISGKYWRLLGRAVEDIEAVLNGRALTSRPQLTSALVGVTDLRIAPSDLVAQFGARASVGSAEETLQQVKIASPENPITTDDSSYDPSLGAGGFVDQSYFPYQSQPIYDWFNAPLHPTSGYQQGS